MSQEFRPSKSEIKFLTLAYNRFYDIFEEVMQDDFWKKDSWLRFSKVKDGFAIYTELLNYEPLGWIIDHIKNNRPPIEAEIGSDLFKFVRNVIIHFPFFEKWNDVCVSEELVNWDREGRSIDKFLNKYSGSEEVKYRFWEADKERTTYLSINFPEEYGDDKKVYLKDILAEKEGIKFSFILIKKILDTQVEEIKDSE